MVIRKVAEDQLSCLPSVGLQEKFGSVSGDHRHHDFIQSSSLSMTVRISLAAGREETRKF